MSIEEIKKKYINKQPIYNNPFNLAENSINNVRSILASCFASKDVDKYAANWFNRLVFVLQKEPHLYIDKLNHLQHIDSISVAESLRYTGYNKIVKNIRIFLQKEGYYITPVFYNFRAYDSFIIQKYITIRSNYIGDAAFTIKPYVTLYLFMRV